MIARQSCNDASDAFGAFAILGWTPEVYSDVSHIPERAITLDAITLGSLMRLQDQAIYFESLSGVRALL